MKYALFSDIHSNWEALERAREYLDQHRVDEIWVLGDTVGYGANPNECFEWMIQNARVAIMGNHEKAVVDPGLREEFSDNACTAVEWTAEILKPEHQKKIPELRYLHAALFATAAHGSPHEPEKFRYLFSFKDAWPAFCAFKTALCFVGHTHLPSLFMESQGTVQPLPPGRYELERNERYLLNPGSIGQPRDGDPRLSFGIFDDQEWAFEVVRLEYDNQKAADKIRKAGLPAHLADRLL